MSDDDDSAQRPVPDTRYLFVALVQLLVEEKILKGPETELLEMLEAWAADLQRETEQEVAISDRVRSLREAWKKLPKQ